MGTKNCSQQGYGKASNLVYKYILYDKSKFRQNKFHSRQSFFYWIWRQSSSFDSYIFL
jgi:hypothetical protein